MRRPTLLGGVAVAAVLAAAAFSLQFLIPAFWYWSTSLFNGIIATLTFLYLLYLMSQSRVKTGRFAVGAIGALILGLGLAIGISWTLMIAVATGLIWITRSVFAYSSILGAVADALLCIAALGLATGAYTMTGSFVWAIWCFFLVQAMFAVIPAAGPPVNPGAASGAAGPGDTFTRAQAAAEMALRQIALRE